MSRTLDSEVLGAINSASVEVIVLCEFDFASGPIRMWSGYGDISWNGQTWIGTGVFLKLGDVAETQDTSSVQLSFSLSGVPSDMLALVLGEQFQGRPCKVYLGAMIGSTGSASPVNMPFIGVANLQTFAGTQLLMLSSGTVTTKTLYASQIYGGTMDTVTIDEGGETSTLALNSQNAFYQLLRSRDLRYTNEAQKALFPADNGLKFVANIQNQQVEWGAAT
mgnify:CR=1 FL=1